MAPLLAPTLAPQPERLEKEHREQLAPLLGYEVCVAGGAYTALRATELMAASFGSACRENDPGRLKLPALPPLREHGYE